jgi:heptaprenyl diphosphate synthase
MNDLRIKQMAEQYMAYDMIAEYTELPDYPEFRVKLLVAFLNSSGLHERSGELYALVVALIQMALDTHDLVPESNGRKEKKDVRSRQLKVLAGDYFSSRFYHLLAQAGEVDLIRRLAGSICEVNRLKTSLYTGMKQFKMTAEDYIEQSVQIHMQMFLDFQHWMEGLTHKLWPEALHSMTKCEVLLQEIFRAESVENFHGSWAYWHILHAGTKEEKKHLQSDEPDKGKLRALIMKYNVSAELHRMFNKQVELLRTVAHRLRSEQAGMELQQAGERLLRMLARPKALEEL